MKKVAYIVRNLNINGISSVILNYCKYLDKNKYKIDIYASDPIANENLNRIKNLNNVNIIKTPSKRGNNPFKYYLFLKRNLKEYDIVHVNGNSRTISLELFISKMNKNKLTIAHSHSTSCDFKIIHYIFKPIFKYLYDIGIACSYKAGVWMFGKEKYEVITNGIEIDDYLFNKEYRNEIRDRIKLDNNCKIIGHVGNFDDVKNYPFILDVFDKICDKYDNYYLLLVGKYENNPKLVDKIKNSKNSKKIILFGPTSEIYKCYNAMDCFIFPSKYEGLGIVALEAQINNLFCLVSNKVPIDVKITDNILFMDINNNNIEEWSKMIINKCNMNRREFNNNSSFYKMNYSISNCIKKIDEIYNKRR